MEEIIVVNKRKAPLLIDQIVIEDTRLNETDIAIYVCLIYMDIEDTDENVVKDIASRFDISIDTVKESFDNLTNSGLLYDVEESE